MPKIRYIGTYPLEVLPGPGMVVGTLRQPGEEFEVSGELAADLIRRPNFEVVGEPKQGGSSEDYHERHISRPRKAKEEVT